MLKDVVFTKCAARIFHDPAGKMISIRANRLKYRHKKKKNKKRGKTYDKN